MNDSITPRKNGIIAEIAEDTTKNLWFFASGGISIADDVILTTMKKCKNHIVL